MDHATIVIGLSVISCCCIAGMAYCVVKMLFVKDDEVSK